MESMRLDFFPVDIELLQDRAQSVPRRRLKLIEQAVALAVDGDHERPQILDPQLDQPIVRDQVLPRHRDELLDRIRQQWAAAPEKRQIDAADLLHGVGALPVEAALAADGAQIEVPDDSWHQRIEARAGGRVHVEHLERAVAVAAVAAEMEERSTRDVDG